jgi:hypothetical protein
MNHRPITLDEEAAHLYQMALDWLAKLSIRSDKEVARVRFRLQDAASVTIDEDKIALLLLDRICGLYMGEKR